jgi:starch-binding outer membrane protein, SusD/RagB family
MLLSNKIKMTKMKKHFIKYAGAVVILLSLALGSCTDLSETVYSEILSSEFVPTENDIPYLVAPVYMQMRPLMVDWQGVFDNQEEPADEIVTPARPNGWYDGGTYVRMHQHTWDAYEWQPWNVWLCCFGGINTANRVIYQIESGAIPMESGKDALLAELKTARAFYYSILLDTHGNVPIVTDYSSTELPTQSTRQQVYDFVVKELTDAIPLLSETVDKSTYARFTKWSAKACLARVYLNAQVYTGTAKWAECQAECQDIIDAEKYDLEPVYKDIFKTENQNSIEIIFAVPYDEIKAVGFCNHMKTLDPLQREVWNMQAQPWGGSCAVPQFIDTYDSDDQRLTDTWVMGPQYDADTKELLITYTKEVPDIYMTARNEGYRQGKYEVKTGAKSSLSNDFVYFRYADILMMKAECLLRTGHADAAALIVTEVRGRDFKSNPSKATVTGAQLLAGSKYNYGLQTNYVVSTTGGGDDIVYGGFLDELGWEFAAEGRRRTDLIRFGVFHTKSWFSHSPSSLDKAIFPIPQEERDKNPNLAQNPSY